MDNCELCQSLIKNTAMDKSLYTIEEEWNKFMENDTVNTNIIPHIIYESWKRSKEKNVNPFHLPQAFLKKADLVNYNTILNTYGNRLLEVQKIADKNEFTLLFFDREGKTNQVMDIVKHIQYDLDLQDIVGFDVSENSIGTNAVVLSLLEKKPMKFLGVYHYNKYGHHKANAVTAPVFNHKGEILGAFCILMDDHKRLNDAFMLVISLAKLFEAKISLMSMKNEMKFHDFVLKNIIESLPQGMIYVNKDNVVEYYNKRILDILKVKGKKDIHSELAKYLPMINNSSVSSKESILNMKESNIIVSSKEITDGDINRKDKIIFLDSRKNELKTNQAGIDNRAIFAFENIIGKNEKLMEAKTIAERVAETSVPILILGESGTGKELFAQSIHNASLRKNQPFVAINCGAIPSELVESELFGYEEGSFTGALKGGKKGKIEIASGGTLFLDEIESMPLNVQIKLLRTLSTNTISKVGGTKEIPVDVRIISATKKDLLKEADNEIFREDLYYRISTFTIELPSLRERIDDIPILSTHFINNFCKKYKLSDIKVHKEFVKALSYYYWRGNIRELENVIERAVVLVGDNGELTVNHLPNKIVKAYNYNSTKERLIFSSKIDNNTKDLIRIGEEIIIESVLKETNCSLTKASEILGISRKTLYNKINESERLTRVKNSYNL